MLSYEKMTKIIGRWTITAEFEYATEDLPVAAATRSKIRPLLHEDGTPDILAINEYEDFVINLLGVFDRCDFDILEERKSPESYSYYFDMVKKDQSNKKDYKYILFIRVSDHDLSTERAKVQKDWYKGRAEALKMPKSKSSQVWRLKRITVNKDTYYSYEEALEDIEKRLGSM